MGSQIVNLPVDIPVQRVLNRLGYGKKQATPGRKVKYLFKRELQRTRDLMDPVAIYSSCPIILKEPHHIIIDNFFHVTSHKLFRFLGKSDRAYLMAITIGDDLERYVSRLQKNGEITRAVITDAIGSETVEQAVITLHKNIRESESEKGFNTTGRFSPGYGDWTLEDQETFLQILATKKIGISLTEQYMMVPRKSVSAMMGVFRTAGVKK